MSDAADNEPSASSTSGTTDSPEDSETDQNRYIALVRKKRIEFLEHILRNLDIIVYAHFSYLYFLDCSFFRFLLRSSVQLHFLTPKPTNFPAPPQRRSVIISLFGSTIFCVLFHLLSANPSANELTHGYLHGGLIIDFIGQEGPISKLRLLFLDVVILLLQLVMLTVVIAKHDLRSDTSRSEAGSSNTPGQDLENEERGEHAHSATQDIRLSGDGPVDRADLEPGTKREELERKTFEISSGEFDVVKINIVGIVKRQWREGRGSADGQRLGARPVNRDGTALP